MKLTKGILLVASLLAIGSARAQISNINEDIANTVNLRSTVEDPSLGGATINAAQPNVQPAGQESWRMEMATENAALYSPSAFENAEINVTKEQIESLQIRIAQMKEEIANLKAKVGPNK